MKKKFDKKAFDAFMAIGAKTPPKPYNPEVLGDRWIFEDLQKVVKGEK